MSNSNTHASEILTTALARELAPGLLRNSIDEKIVRIRPMSTPIDQISRCAGARGVKSMVVEYYSVDTKPTSAKITADVSVSVGNDDGPVAVTLHTDNDKIFDNSETVIVPGAYVTAADGTRTPVQLYVTSGGADSAPGAGVGCQIGRAHV